MGANACKCESTGREPNEHLLFPNEIQVFEQDPYRARVREDNKFLDKNKRMHFNRVLTEQSLERPGAIEREGMRCKTGCDNYEQTPVIREKSVARKQITLDASITPVKGRFNKHVNTKKNAVKEYPLVQAIHDVDLGRDERKVEFQALRKQLDGSYVECNYLKGTLDKFHPGFTLSYVPRECKVTREYFEYYSDAIRYLKLPLIRLWVRDIDSVLKVNVQSSEVKVEALHQFEIVMKPSWDPRRSCIYKNSKPPIKEEKGRNSSFSNLRNPSINSFIKTVDSNLMKRPELLNNLKGIFPCSQERKKYFKVYKVDGVNFSSKSESQLYSKYLSENKARLTRTANLELINVKNPKKWIKGLSSSHTWSNRELEWYLAEQRMLFVARSQNECDRWVVLLNWLLSL
eukprot:TRINITY_DN5231_c0_g1_i10.p1 TRINITY_DN5231_c0_g1~~TRINITY_DN5231_c0_g1_i10.p1  ORF type:complete len:402 (+),score=89.02 TRINITY_DN5231_c0_g1_i10:151-1356(+)